MEKKPGRNPIVRETRSQSTVGLQVIDERADSLDLHDLKELTRPTEFWGRNFQNFEPAATEEA